MKTSPNTSVPSGTPATTSNGSQTGRRLRPVRLRYLPGVPSTSDGPRPGTGTPSYEFGWTEAGNCNDAIESGGIEAFNEYADIPTGTPTHTGSYQPPLHGRPGPPVVVVTHPPVVSPQIPRPHPPIVPPQGFLPHGTQPPVSPPVSPPVAAASPTTLAAPSSDSGQQQTTPTHECIYSECVYAQWAYAEWAYAESGWIAVGSERWTGDDSG